MVGDIYVCRHRHVHVLVYMYLQMCTCTVRTCKCRYICCSPQTGQQMLSCLGTATDLLDVSKQHCEPS